MGLLDFFKSNNSGVQDVQNADKNKPKSSNISNRLQKTQVVRAKADILLWRKALQSAESVVNPNRLDLLKIYNEVILDPHFTAVMDQRINKVLARGFKLVDNTGEENEEKTQLLQKEWFEKFLRYSMEAKFFGFSLIEFDSLVNDEFKDVSITPREYIVPERQTIKTTLAGGTEYSFETPPLSIWALFVGGKYELGLLNKATPWVLWKRLVAATWAEYNELYGVPLRIGKTNALDAEARANMEEMLENLGSSAWGLFSEDDEIEIINGVKVGGQGTFRDYIDLADEQISKLIVGQTMTTDEGSSRSQAEVHADTLASYTGADLRQISYLVNNRLFPFMTSKGVQLDGFKFVWDLEEKLSLEQQFAIDRDLLNYYKIPADYITKKYGTPVEEMEAAPQPQPNNGITVMNDVASLYKDFFKHGEGCNCGNC